MRKSIMSLVVVALLAMTVSAALSESVKNYLAMYDDFALRNIWRNMV